MILMGSPVIHKNNFCLIETKKKLVYENFFFFNCQKETPNPSTPRYPMVALVWSFFLYFWTNLIIIFDISSVISYKLVISYIV